MSAETVLFVGGPEDGNLRALPREQHYAVTAQIPAIAFSAAEYRALPDAYSVTASSEIRTTTYRRESLSLFGRRIDVMAEESLFRYGNGLNEAAMRHLLSPVALGLIGGRR